MGESGHMFTFCGLVEFTTSSVDNVLTVVGQYVNSTRPTSLLFLDRNASVGYRIVVSIQTLTPVQVFLWARAVYPVASGDFQPFRNEQPVNRTGGSDQWEAVITKLNGNGFSYPNTTMDVLWEEPNANGAVGTAHYWHYNSTMVVQFWGFCM